MQGRACKQCISDPSYNTSTFNAVRFDENPFTCLCNKEDEKAEGFQIWYFYWSLSSDIMAVKELISSQVLNSLNWACVRLPASHIVVLAFIPCWTCLLLLLGDPARSVGMFPTRHIVSFLCLICSSY